MTISATKLFVFEAAHQLLNHSGKCARLHGHSYKLEVTVSGPLQKSGPAEGMIVDFDDLSKVVKEQIIQKFDHQFLNEIVEYATTVENLASDIFLRLSTVLPIEKVVLWETAKIKATVTN